MDDIIIDRSVKSYLVACLVTGIDVTARPDIFMNELVDHLNSIERIYYATGDEDGIILHNKIDIPILYISFNGRRLTFRALDEDGFSAFETKQEIAIALVNIIGFLKEKDYKHMPSILNAEMYQTADTDLDDNQEDWAL